jgi:hypothetical protein
LTREVFLNYKLLFCFDINTIETKIVEKKEKKRKQKKRKKKKKKAIID